MNYDKIIDGLRMTMELIVFDPSTGKEYSADILNAVDRATYDACKGALEILERLDTDSDTISRKAAIEALKSCYCGGEDSCGEPWIYESSAIDAIKKLPPAQPAPSQVAKDIARIVENEQDMRVIQPEIIYCKDCKKQNRHYHESPYKDTVCPLTAWRGTAQGHEYDYQFCCFAERREVTT